MRVEILFFAHYRDVVPGGRMTLELPDGATVADAAARLAATDARLADILNRTRVAVDAEFTEPDTMLKEGDEVAFLPPMSGG